MSQHLPPEILEAYAFANTPAYLFKKLNTSKFVSSLIEHPTKELIEYINSSSKDNPESVALAYATIIALLRKNIDLSPILELPEAKKLEWIPILINLYKKTVSSTTAQKMILPGISNTATSSPVIVTNTPFTITHRTQDK